MATAKKIPVSENGPGVKSMYITASGEEYVISQCLAPRRFTLWKHGMSGYEKLKTSGTPVELYEVIEWDNEKKEKTSKKSKIRT